MQTANREPMRDRLKQFIESRLLDRDQEHDFLPEDFSVILDGDLMGWESVFLGTHVLALLYRGAPADACVRYVTDRDVALPSMGCEEHLFDLLLTCLQERIGEADTIARMVEILAEFQSTPMATVDRGGISPRGPGRERRRRTR